MERDKYSCQSIVEMMNNVWYVHNTISVSGDLVMFGNCEGFTKIEFKFSLN